MLAVLDNNDRLQCLTDDYFDSSLHTFLQGTAAFFTCSVLQTAEIAQYFKVGNKLSFVSNEVSYHFDITKMNKNEQLVTIQADSLTLELRNEFASEYKASKAMTFKQYLDVFLFAGDNPLVMGINEVSDKSLQTEWTGDSDSVLARLFSLANKFDAEIEFETVLNKHWGLDKVRLNVYRAHSDKYQGIGKKRTDIIMEYGNNVETVEYEENIDDLKTAILPIGTDGLLIGNVVIDEKDKNGNQLFLSIKTDNYIRAVQSRDRFRSKMGSFDGYIAKRWTYETTNENVLAGQALAELKKLCEPKVTVTIKGYEYLGIGDTVLVQNTAYVPTLNLSARISEQEIYFDDPSKNSSTFTNVEILQSQVDQSLIDRVNALIEQTKPYTLSIISDNGVNFKNSEGSTTLSAVVYGGTKDITADVTVRWYKNDVWVKTAYNVTVNASDIIDKAVYRAEVMDTNGVIRAKAEVTVFNVDDGRGIKGKPVLSYASSGSINTVPTTWQATIPAVPAGSYLWTREVTTYTDDTTSEVITPVLMGPQGKPGDEGKAGKGIIDSKQEWAASTSGTTAPTSWQTAIPTVSAGQYLWSRVTETWSDNTHTYRFTIGKIGENGRNAQMMFLSADKNTMMFNADNTAKFAQTATVTAKYQNVSGTVAFTAKGIKANGTSETLTLTGTGDSRTIKSAMFKTDWVMITVTATLAGLTDVLSIIKVNDGAQGIGGPKGYFHSAWAMSADGRTGFSTTVSEGKWYIGTYFDFVEADSTDPARYNWLELAGAVKMYNAYAWSQDGKDRFTRVKPNENIITQSPSGVSLISTTTNEFDFHDVFKISQNYQTLSNWTALDEVFTLGFSWESSTDLPAGASIGIFFGNAPWAWNFDASNKVSGRKGSVSKTGNNGSGLYNSVQTGMTIRFKNIPVGTTITITKVFVIAGNGQSFVPSSQDDYDNAVPRYIGRSLKDSNNPADFTWEPNPERKPWTAYAQGLNGEGFSLMPYGENLLTGTSTTLRTDKTTNFIIPYWWDTVKSFLDKKITLQAYIENAPYDARVQFWSNSGGFLVGSVIPKGKSGISYVTGTISSKATDGNIALIFVGQDTPTEPATLPYSKLKLELANTMGTPTPWTPAPSEDPLGAIPKYVGTAALPYEDFSKYAWDLNPAWLQQESNNNLANKVDNNTYNNERSNVWTEISNRVTKEEAQAIQKSLDKVTGAYTDFVSTGGKHDQDLANLKRAINTDIQKLADKVLGFDFVNTWFRIGDGGLSIGEANSNFEILVSNDQITFYDSGTAVAYVSNQSFFINSGMIVDDLQIGKFKFAKVNDNLMGLFHIA